MTKRTLVYIGDRFSYWWLGILIVMTPFVAACWFIHPMVDDYLFAETTRAHGFAKAQSLYYSFWIGRYFSTTLLCSLNPLLARSLFLYRLIPPALMIGVAGSLFFLIRTIFGQTLRSSHAWLLTGGLEALFFLGMPSTAEGFFWMTGGYTYTLALPLSICFLAIIIKLLSRGNDPSFSTGRRRLLIAGAAGISILIAGCNEISMLTMICMLFMIFIFRWRAGRKPEGFLLLILSVFAVAMVAEMTAPGNKVRALLTLKPGEGHNFSQSTINSLRQMIVYMLSWSALLFPGIILLLESIFKILRNKDLRLPPIFNIHPLLALGVCPLLIFIGLFPGFWAQGRLLPLRAINIIFFYFALASAYFMTTLVSYRMKAMQHHLLPQWAYAAGLTLLFVCLLPAKNLRTSWSDLLRGKMRRYNREQLQRYRLITDCNQPVCMLDALHDKPATIFYEDFSAEPRELINFSLASFFGKPGIEIKGSPRIVYNDWFDQFKWDIRAEQTGQPIKTGFYE